MTTPDDHGPIDLLVLQFPPDADGRAVRAALADLVDGGTIRLYDLMVVRKAADGTITEVDLSATEGRDIDLDAFKGARSGLLGEGDLADMTGLLDPDTIGAVLVYENSWAIPFVAAAREAGGAMVATTRLTAQAINDALDAVEGKS